MDTHIDGRRAQSEFRMQIVVRKKTKHISVCKYFDDTITVGYILTFCQCKSMEDFSNFILELCLIMLIMNQNIKNTNFGH